MGKRPALTVEPIVNPASAVDPLPAITTTSTGLSRGLSNLAKFYTDEAKYSG